MKIAILSRSTEIFSTKRLVEAAKQKGHEVQVVNPLDCFMNISATEPEIFCKDEKVVDVDVVIPRIGASITFYGTAVLRQFESIGAIPLNHSVSIAYARDKLRAHQVLSKAQIPMPITGFAHSTRNTHDLINMVKGAPLIVKLLSGTQGQGVVLAETRKAAESVIHAFRGMKAYFLVQQFIAEAENTDIRAIVLGDQVIAAMKRTAREGDFRANYSLGGSAENIELSEEEKDLAVKAAKALGITFGGVDLIRSKNGTLLLEVNSSPGLKGIEHVSGIDIAGKVIDFTSDLVEEYRKFA